MAAAPDTDRPLMNAASRRRPTRRAPQPLRGATPPGDGVILLRPCLARQRRARRPVKLACRRRSVEVANCRGLGTPPDCGQAGTPLTALCRARTCWCNHATVAPGLAAAMQPPHWPAATSALQSPAVTCSRQGQWPSFAQTCFSTLLASPPISLRLLQVPLACCCAGARDRTCRADSYVYGPLQPGQLRPSTHLIILASMPASCGHASFA